MLVNDLEKDGEQRILAGRERFSRRRIVVRFKECQQEASPELAPSQGRCQAAQKISRTWPESFCTWDHCGANRLVEGKAESQQLLLDITSKLHHAGIARLQEPAFVRFCHGDLQAAAVQG